MLKLKIQKTLGTFQFKLRFPSGRIRAVTNRLRSNERNPNILIKSQHRRM